MPESPRYLSLNGDTETAKEILVKFKTDDRDIENDLQLWSTSHKVGILSTVKRDFSIAYVVSLFGLYIFEQLIGAVPILFYLRKIFKLTGTTIIYDESHSKRFCQNVNCISILFSLNVRRCGIFTRNIDNSVRRCVCG